MPGVPLAGTQEQSGDPLPHDLDPGWDHAGVTGDCHAGVPLAGIHKLIGFFTHCLLAASPVPAWIFPLPGKVSIFFIVFTLFLPLEP